MNKSEIININESKINKLRLKYAFNKLKNIKHGGFLKFNSKTNKIEYFTDDNEKIDFEYICNFGYYDDAIKLYPTIKEIKNKTNLSYRKIKQLRVLDFDNYIELCEKYS